MITTNVRYPIADELIDTEIRAACARLETTRQQLKTSAASTREAYAHATTWSGSPPQSDEQIDAMVDGWIREQWNRYASVRVVRLAGRADSEKSYVLVYGEVDNDKVGSGTGPFASLGEAIGWFTNGGR